MEVYSYGNAQAFLQPSLYKTNRDSTLEGASKSRNINKTESNASFYIDKLEPQHFGKESKTNVDKLNTADTYIERLQVMLNKLKETNSPETAKEISYLKVGLTEVLDKFPMLTAAVTKVANWDIKTLIGRSAASNNLLKEMKEDITFMQMEVKVASRKELEDTDTKRDAEKVGIFLSALNTAKESSHQNNFTNRVVDLIT